MDIHGTVEWSGGRTDGGHVLKQHAETMRNNAK